MLTPVSPDDVRSDCEFRLRVVEPGFSTGEVIAAGTTLYDPMVGWFDPDGSMVFSDHGPQKEPGWDPAKGHGGIHRLYPDDHVEVVLPVGSYDGMPFNIRRAPAWFGDWEGQIFFTSQSVAGRQGARSQHDIYRMAIGDSAPTRFAEIPRAGRINDGVPGALMIGGFGRKGTTEEGYYICNSMVNGVVYRIPPDGKAEPWIILDQPAVPAPIQPYFISYAGPSWGSLEGKLLLAGRPGSNYTDDAPADHDLDYWVIDDGRVTSEPVHHEDMGLGMAEVAPPEFGPFGGHTFWVHHGSLNLMHVTKSPPSGPLKYDCKIFRIDLDGNTHLFADGIQGGWNEIRFDGPRLLMSLLRRSYSTGEYHEPDGSIYEIRYSA